MDQQLSIALLMHGPVMKGSEFLIASHYALLCDPCEPTKMACHALLSSTR